MTYSTRHFLRLIGTGALVAALAPSKAFAQPADNAAKNKVVFQMSDNDPTKWNLALNNMRNLQVDLGDDAVALELVAYGPGIGMLKADSPVARRIAEAVQTGAKVVACENTMKGQGLSKADMLPEVGYVASGVVELMRRQQQGYAYIRP